MRSVCLPSEGEGPCPYGNRVGREMFHVLDNALAVAAGINRRAGSKVKKVRVLKGHFMVMDA